MPSYLGLYIEENLIKYAKVSKNNDVIKVESFGVKFYENITNAVSQIVEETYSFKTPIAINTTEELYNQLQIFSLLSKKDIASAVKTEFEHICYDKEINRNIYEERYLLTNSNSNGDKVKAIHIALPKTFIEQRKNQFGEYKISSILPVSISIANLPQKDKKMTSLVVNIENNTTITKLINGTNVSEVFSLNVGAKEILSNIKKKENSYLKSYEICKNTTIYTESDRDLQYEENEYLEDIMPTLYQIVSQVRKIAEESIENIEKIYITGTGALINNIDIYFQENLKSIQCEILKPHFVGSNSKINIKDYIEVNSAIALALLALDKNNKSINFTKESSVNRVWALLKTDISKKDTGKVGPSVNVFLERYKRPCDITSFSIGFITIMYLLISIVINKQLENRIDLTNDSISVTKDRISKINEYNELFNSHIDEYEKLISEIENMNDVNSEDKRFKNTIPNLLNNLMAVIPKNVKLLSIENTSNTHVVIKAQSSKYEEMAFFKTKLKVEEILENVVSDTGTIQGEILNVTIEGELP